MTTPGTSTDAPIPAALVDRAHVAWRRPDAFTAWCQQHLPAVERARTATTIERLSRATATWVQRYTWARSRWARSHGYTRHLMLDERRLRAAGTAPPTGAERAAARRGIDVPVDAALAAAISTDQR